MHCTVKMTEDLYWVGASDRRLALFESVYPIPRGVSYNAYVLLDEKTVLLDTVDQSVAGQFFENLTHVLGGRPLDYIVVHHMEPDHAAAVADGAKEVVREVARVRAHGAAVRVRGDHGTEPETHHIPCRSLRQVRHVRQHPVGIQRAYKVAPLCREPLCRRVAV